MNDRVCSEGGSHRRLKIGFLTQWFDPEPGATRGLPLATTYSDEGHDLTVVTGFPNYPDGNLYDGYRLSLTQVERMGSAEVPVVRLPLYPYHGTNPVGRILNFATFWAALRALGRPHVKDVDCLYVYHPPIFPALVAAAWRRRGGPPFVVHVSDLWPQSVVDSGMLPERVARIANSALRRLCSTAYDAAESISVLSHGFKQQLIDEYSIDPEKIVVVYNWADEAIFSPGAVDTARLKEWELEGKFVLMYAGLLGDFQGLETLVDAAAELQDLTDIEVVFVGDGRARESLEQRVSDLGLTNTRFVGRLDYRAMGGVTQLADLHFVSLRDLPFLRRTVPGKVAQLLCAGQVVVGAVHGDAADMIEQGGGIAVASGDALAVADAVRRVHAMSREERRERRNMARTYYTDHLSSSTGALRTMQMLQRAATVSSETQ